jgi:predicted transcriptional regulator
MPKRPPLSKAELEVARIVWGLRRATVRQVADALPPDRTLDYKTVQTFLRRLEAKGYVRSTPEGRSLVYAPTVKPERVIRDTVREFLGRLFGGEAMPLMEHMIRDQGLTGEEIEKLRRLLDELEQGNAGGRRD